MWHVPLGAMTRSVSWLLFAAGLVAWNPTVSGAECIDYSTNPPYPLIGSLEIADRMMSDLAVVGSHVYLTAFIPVTLPNGQLYIVDISDAAHPEIVGSTGGGGYPGSVVSNGSHAYVITGNQFETSVRVYDVDPPDVAVGIAAVPTSGLELALVDDLLYVANWQLEIMDVSNPANPATIGVLNVQVSNPQIVVSGAYAYMTGTESPGRFVVVNVSDPTTPTIVGEYTHNSGNGFRALAVHGDLAVVRSGTELVAIDVSDPSAPTVVGQLDVPGAGELAFDPSGALYTYGEVLTVCDFTDPTQPQLIGATTPPNGYGRLAVTDSHVHLLHVNWVNYRMHLDLLPVQCPATQSVETAPAPAAIVALETPRPNPFRGQTAIHYQLAAADHVNLRILDVQGRLVRRLEDDAWKLPGSHHAVWDGRDERGREVAPGMYYVSVRLTRPDGRHYSASRGLTLLE